MHWYFCLVAKSRCHVFTTHKDLLWYVVFVLYLLNTYKEIGLGRKKPNSQNTGYVLHFTCSFGGLYERVSKICASFKWEVLYLPIPHHTKLYAQLHFTLRCNSRYQQIGAFALNASFIPQKRCSILVWVEDVTNCLEGVDVPYGILRQ